jgi:DNA-binding response OmpR family regulator
VPIILTVDNSTTNNLLIQDILQENDYKVIVAGRGQTALKLITRQFPDLVLLELKMVDMDGYTVLKKLLTVMHLPVIIVSANDDAEGKQKALDMGAKDYITKPIIIKELLEKVEKALLVKF